MKLGEKGFTLVELLMVTAIVALIANGAAMGIFQVLRNTESNRNQMTAVSQVQNAGYWISRDAQRAQTVEVQMPEGPGGYTVSWSQSESGSLEDSDYFRFAFSGDGGSSWSEWENAFHNDNPPSYFSYSIPDQYLTDDFKIRFFADFNSSYEYVYIDDILIYPDVTIFFDDCSNFDIWDNGEDWNVYYGEFRGHHDYSEPDRYLTMSTSLDLSSYQGETVTVLWDQRERGSLRSSDALYFAFSDDGGSTWGSNIEAFSDDIGSTPRPFSYTIPQQYLTDDFRMRYYLASFSGDDPERAYLDNIAIRVSEWSDDCSNFDNWDNGNNWSVYYGEEFRGQGGGSSADRLLTLTDSLNVLIPGEFPITFTWATWSESGGTEHQAIYSIVDGKLIRSYSIIVDGAPTETTETHVAQYIDPYSSSCQFANGKLTLRVAATVGAGAAGVSESRQFRVLTRPD